MRNLCRAVMLALSAHLILAAPTMAQEEDTAALADRAFQLLGLAGQPAPTSDPGAIAAGLPLLERAADGGSAIAQNALGAAYGAGWFGLAPDNDRALAYFELAAMSGDIREANVAKLNWAIRQLESDQAERAVALLNEVHESGPPLAARAAAELAVAYSVGLGVARDFPRAKALYEEAIAANPGDAASHYMLARGLINGAFSDTPDSDTALPHFRIAADQGHPLAAWEIGKAYLEGRGSLDADPREAYRWFAQAAETGSTEGMISTAVMLATGDGVERDPEAAARWYETAASAGSVHAMRGLGAMHFFDELPEVDHIEGLALLELAAEAGEPVAAQIRAQTAPAPDEQQRQQVDFRKQAWRERLAAAAQ